MSSRDSSPTSPLYSPLTPAHDDEEEQQYLEMSAQEADYDNYLQSLQHSSSDEDDDESTLSDMPTDTHGDTIVFSSDDTPQTSQPEQKSSDRAAGFHEETARKRQATRDDAEEVCAGQSDSELKRAPIEHEENDTRQEQGEDNGEKEVAVENPIELKAEREMVPPARSQAPWVSDAVAACKANKRNPLKNGNVLVVFDATDFAKSCLIDAGSFTAIKALQALQQDSKDRSKDCTSEDRLMGLLILSTTASPTPELLPLALDASIESLQSKERPTPTGTAKTRAAENARIKAERSMESQDVGANLVTPEPDWANAYETFFRIIGGKRKSAQLSRTNFAAALPQIESIVSIAQSHDAVLLVRKALTDLLLGYIEEETLYSTIASEPARCLNVGIALQSRLIYDEAFKHLVGIAANFKAGRPFDDLSIDVQAAVHRRSQELYSKRIHVFMELVTITLPVEKTGEPAPDYPTAVVSQHEQPEAYCMVNIFRDWMSEHTGYLGSQPTGSEPAANSYLCAHGTGCTTVAGFFRTILAGGDLYLPAEKVLEDWEGGSLTIDDAGEETGDIMKAALTYLKNEAAGCVRDLVGSELKLRDRDTCAYLTCVKASPEDVPWGTEQDGECEDDMDYE